MSLGNSGASGQEIRRALMYLPFSYWSPRYDSSFYTVKVDGRERIIEDLPLVPDEVGGKQDLRAYYYRVTVYREREKTSFLRRYSQFHWLYDQISAKPPTITNEQRENSPGTPIRMPAKSCPFIQRQDENFARNRQELLSQFLEDILGRPGYASHEAVCAFLELK